MLMSDQEPQDLDTRRKALEIEKLEVEIREIQQKVDADQRRWKLEFSLKVAATISALAGSMLYLVVKDWLSSGG